ncbi:8988_t:CDS:2 [Cetraspora pellucida]|uniref:8988_t:CDS:1 n=1 Tax=Cetraspora pellucida TaxID=1433469 RepID=A0A9N8WDH8_9GLOM|nr:8988_t:CDS:2 [Cetraspora pellucida]
MHNHISITSTISAIGDYIPSLISTKAFVQFQSLFYALSSHIIYMLQSSELSFTKLKNEYSKDCNKLHNNKTITNTYRVTGI